MKRRTRTITETHEVWVIRRVQEPSVSSRAACADCGAAAVMLAPESAAALCGLSTRAVYALVEAGRAHFAERPDGEINVCLDSLSAAARGRAWSKF